MNINKIYIYIYTNIYIYIYILKVQSQNQMKVCFYTNHYQIYSTTPKSKPSCSESLAKPPFQAN